MIPETRESPDQARYRQGVNNILPENLNKSFSSLVLDFRQNVERREAIA